MDTEQNAIILNTSAGTLAAADITADAVVDMFLAQHDAKDSSISLYRRALRQFFAWARRTGRSTQYMTKADIIAYKKGLLDGTATPDENTGQPQPKSPLTAASYLNAVKLFYTWLHDENGTITNIAAGVDLPQRESKFERQPLTAQQAAELLAEVKQNGSARDYAIVSLLLHTGMRTIEAVRADIKDMRRIGDDMVLYVQGKGKDRKDIPVPLSADTYAAITDYLTATRPTATPEQPLFTCAGNRNKEGRLTTRTITGIARKHLDAIGLSHNFGERNSEYTAHSFRHTYGCAMLDACEDENMVRMLMRHASVATTRFYVYHREEQRRLAAAKKYNIDSIYNTAK